MTDKTAILETLRDAIDIALCEEEGHEWVRVTERAVLGSDAKTNTFPVEQCGRCGKRRASIFGDSSTTNEATTTGPSDKRGVEPNP